MFVENLKIEMLASFPLSQITYFNIRQQARTHELHKGIASCSYAERLVVFLNEQDNYKIF